MPTEEIIDLNTENKSSTESISMGRGAKFLSRKILELMWPAHSESRNFNEWENKEPDEAKRWLEQQWLKEKWMSPEEREAQEEIQKQEKQQVAEKMDEEIDNAIDGTVKSLSMEQMQYLEEKLLRIYLKKKVNGTMLLSLYSWGTSYVFAAFLLELQKKEPKFFKEIMEDIKSSDKDIYAAINNKEYEPLKNLMLNYMEDIVKQAVVSQILTQIAKRLESKLPQEEGKEKIQDPKFEFDTLLDLKAAKKRFSENLKKCPDVSSIEKTYKLYNDVSLEGFELNLNKDKVAAEKNTEFVCFYLQGNCVCAESMLDEMVQDMTEMQKNSGYSLTTVAINPRAINGSTGDYQMLEEVVEDHVRIIIHHIKELAEKYQISMKEAARRVVLKGYSLSSWYGAAIAAKLKESKLEVKFVHGSSFDTVGQFVSPIKPLVNGVANLGGGWGKSSFEDYRKLNENSRMHMEKEQDALMGDKSLTRKQRNTVWMRENLLISDLEKILKHILALLNHYEKNSLKGLKEISDKAAKKKIDKALHKYEALLKNYTQFKKINRWISQELNYDAALYPELLKSTAQIEKAIKTLADLQKARFSGPTLKLKEKVEGNTHCNPLPDFKTGDGKEVTDWFTDKILNHYEQEEREIQAKRIEHLLAYLHKEFKNDSEYKTQVNAFLREKTTVSHDVNKKAILMYCYLQRKQTDQNDNYKFYREKLENFIKTLSYSERLVLSEFAEAEDKRLKPALAALNGMLEQYQKIMEPLESLSQTEKNAPQNLQAILTEAHEIFQAILTAVLNELQSRVNANTDKTDEQKEATILIFRNFIFGNKGKEDIIGKVFRILIFFKSEKIASEYQEALQIYFDNAMPEEKLALHTHVHDHLFGRINEGIGFFKTKDIKEKIFTETKLRIEDFTLEESCFCLFVYCRLKERELLSPLLKNMFYYLEYYLLNLDKKNAKFRKQLEEYKNLGDFKDIFNSKDIVVKSFIEDSSGKDISLENEDNITNNSKEKQKEHKDDLLSNGQTEAEKTKAKFVEKIRQIENLQKNQKIQQEAEEKLKAEVDKIKQERKQAAATLNSIGNVEDFIAAVCEIFKKYAETIKQKYEKTIAYQVHSFFRGENYCKANLNNNPEYSGALIYSKILETVTSLEKPVSLEQKLEVICHLLSGKEFPQLKAAILQGCLQMQAPEAIEKLKKLERKIKKDEHSELLNNLIFQLNDRKNKKNTQNIPKKMQTGTNFEEQENKDLSHQESELKIK